MPKLAVLCGLLLVLTGCGSTIDNNYYRSYSSYDASNSNPPPVDGRTAVNVQLSDNHAVDRSMQVENEPIPEEEYLISPRGVINVKTNLDQNFDNSIQQDEEENEEEIKATYVDY